MILRSVINSRDIILRELTIKYGFHTYQKYFKMLRFEKFCAALLFNMYSLFTNRSDMTSVDGYY